MVFYKDTKGEIYEASEPRGSWIDMKKGDKTIKNAHALGRTHNYGSKYAHTYVKKDGLFKYIYTIVFAGDPK